MHATNLTKLFYPTICSLSIFLSTLIVAGRRHRRGMNQKRMTLTTNSDVRSHSKKFFLYHWLIARCYLLNQPFHFQPRFLLMIVFPLIQINPAFPCSVSSLWSLTKEARLGSIQTGLQPASLLLLHLLLLFLFLFFCDRVFFRLVTSMQGIVFRQSVNPSLAIPALPFLSLFDSCLKNTWDYAARFWESWNMGKK